MTSVGPQKGNANQFLLDAEDMFVLKRFEEAIEICDDFIEETRAEHSFSSVYMEAIEIIY